MEQRTREQMIAVLRPVALALGFVFKAAYYVVFAWWLDPLLQRRANRELFDDVTNTLDFLTSESGSLKFVRAAWPTIEVSWGNLLFTVVRWRGDTVVSVAPRHAPLDSYEIGPAIAAVEHRHFSERDVVNGLPDVATLLRPRLETLNAAFSKQEFPHTKERL